MSRIKIKGNLFGQNTWCVYCDQELGEYIYNGESVCKEHLIEQREEKEAKDNGKKEDRS